MVRKTLHGRRDYLKTVATASVGAIATTGIAAAHEKDPSNLRLQMDLIPNDNVEAEDQDYIVSATEPHAAASDYYCETDTDVTNGGDRVSHDSDQSEWRGTVDDSSDTRDRYFYDGEIYTYYLYKTIDAEIYENGGSFQNAKTRHITIDGDSNNSDPVEYTVYFSDDTEPIKGKAADSDDSTGVNSIGGYVAGTVDDQDTDAFTAYGDIKRILVSNVAEETYDSGYFRIRMEG